MKNKSSKSSRGLVSKLVAPVLIGAAALMPVGRAGGGYVELNSDFGTAINAPDVQIWHYPAVGATDAYNEYIDTPYNQDGFPPPAVDFFSQILAHNLDPTKLIFDVRDNSSLTSYNTKMQGRDLTSTLSGNLSFTLSDPDNDFGTLPILADIYKNGIIEHIGIDVRDYSVHSSDINYQLPLTLTGDNDFYNVDVRFTNDLCLENIVSSGNITVHEDSNLTANSIACTGLIIGAGAKVTINPVSEGALSGSNINNVPEPGTLTLLSTIALMGLGLATKKIYKK